MIRKKAECTFIDAAIVGDRNVIKKRVNKMLQYESRRVYIECKNKVIPIAGATGTISKYLANT
jgi:hypothetical protein